MKHQHRASAGIFGTSDMSVASESGGAVAGSVAAETAEASATAAPHGSAMLIELDPAVHGNLIHNRFDIMIRGRVISNVAITDIRPQVGDQVISTACYAQPERASAAMLPDGRPARQRAFQFTLPCRPHALRTNVLFPSLRILKMTWKEPSISGSAWIRSQSRLFAWFPAAAVPPCR